MRDAEFLNAQYEAIAPTLGFNAQKIEQVSPEWFSMRLGVITGTGSAKACGSKAIRETYKKQIISDIMMA